MLAFPERILAGAVPNVDFLHLYGPGALDVLAGWYTVFGYTLERRARLRPAAAPRDHRRSVRGRARAWGRRPACVSAGLSLLLI